MGTQHNIRRGGAPFPATTSYSIHQDDDHDELLCDARPLLAGVKGGKGARLFSATQRFIYGHGHDDIHLGQGG